MTELKPCPFCGGKPKIYLHSVSMEGYELKTVKCEDCRAGILGYNMEVEKAWNTRAQPELIELQNAVYEDVCNTLDEIMVVHHMTLNYSDPRKSINELLNIVSDISEYFTGQKAQPEWVSVDRIKKVFDGMQAVVSDEGQKVAINELLQYILCVIKQSPAPPEKG